MRPYRCLIAVLLLLSAVLFSQLLAANKDSYTAAVVDYSPSYNPQLEPEQNVLNNVGNFITFIKDASALNADIIVFPEIGINGYDLNANLSLSMEVPSAEDNKSPCDNSQTLHPVLVKLSCAARQYKIYIVVNLGEKFFNSTRKDTQYFNTNVAFNRNGTIVARYRKYNLFGQSHRMQPGSVEYSYFDTDFGVRFGTFICFDIIFKDPPIVLNRDYNIQHFIFTSAWFSQMPFLTAIQKQWGWAYGLDVVLLASGYNKPQVGSTGSGIYQGRFGALVYYMSEVEGSKLLVSAVLKKMPSAAKLSGNQYLPYKEDNDWLYSYRDVIEFKGIATSNNNINRIVTSNSSLTHFLLKTSNLKVYETKQLLFNETCNDSNTCFYNGTTVTTTKSLLTTICQSSLCCKFNITMTNTFVREDYVKSMKNRGDDYSRYYYRIAAFDGVEHHLDRIAGLQVCAIIPCTNDTIESCSRRADDDRSAQPYRLLLDAAYGQFIQTATVFESIDITASIINNDTFLFPQLFVTGSGSNFGALVPTDTFTFIKTPESSNTAVVTLKTQTSITNLITAAVYARQFYRDDRPKIVVTKSPAPNSVSHFSNVILVITLIYNILYTNITQ